MNVIFEAGARGREEGERGLDTREERGEAVRGGWPGRRVYYGAGKCALMPGSQFE